MPTVNHDEALQLAHLKREESNLARCYIELRSHDHRIADARNAAVQSGYVCVDCGAVFEAADHGAKGPAKEPTSSDEPFWYAVVSDEAPTINKAFRRADVADRYASICRENGYPLAEVIPLYRRPSGVAASRPDLLAVALHALKECQANMPTGNAWHVAADAVMQIEHATSGVSAAPVPDVMALQWAVKTLRFLLPGSPVGPHAQFEWAVQQLTSGVKEVPDAG